MTEFEINQILIRGKKASEYQLKQGNKAGAIDLLKIASRYCASLINIYKLNGVVECENCGTAFKKDVERDYVREFGVCMGCDDLYADAIEDQRRDNLN